MKTSKYSGQNQFSDVQNSSERYTTLPFATMLPDNDPKGETLKGETLSAAWSEKTHA